MIFNNFLYKICVLNDRQVQVQQISFPHNFPLNTLSLKSLHFMKTCLARKADYLELLHLQNTSRVIISRKQLLYILINITYIISKTPSVNHCGVETYRM